MTRERATAAGLESGDKQLQSLLPQRGDRVPSALFVVALLCLTIRPTAGQTYTVLRHFMGGAGGANPKAGLVLFGTDLYGTTYTGGSSGGGTLFSLNTNGTGYTVVKNFGGWHGFGPSALALSGNMLYGTTWSGGTSNQGALFKIQTDGADFAVLKNFARADGVNPQGDLLVMPDGSLYGATAKGGGYGIAKYSHGVLYWVSGASTFMEFDFGIYDGYLGSIPNGGLVKSGSSLYGTTQSGNANACSNGVVFRTGYVGSDTLIKVFGGGDGATPKAGLVLSGSTLYGTTSAGGLYGGGTVFSLNTNGSSFTTLKHFNGADGSAPQANLLLAGDTLYGTTSSTIFRLKTDGSDFAVLKRFGGTDGSYSTAPLLLVNDMLYGTTVYGGNFNNGVVFSLSLVAPRIITPPQTQTVESGGSVDISTRAESAPLNYLWYHNDSTLLSYGTNNHLKLSNCQFSQIGTYHVIVTNLFGAATSSPAMLNVISPVERRLVPAISLQAEPGSTWRVEYADSLQSPGNWLPLNAAVVTSGQLFSFDAASALPPRRFYRATQRTTLAPAAFLDLDFVPAITLTGAIGSLRLLEFVNQFGPTNAWIPVGTVTLTNTTQLYFDTTTIGEPPRLYRISNR